MGDAESNKTFPKQGQRFAFCNSVFDDTKKKQRAKQEQMTKRQVTWATLTVDAHAPLRTEKLQGRDHLVVSAVLVQGQILHNNLGTTFLPPEAITDEWAKEWNGIPVIIHDHPTNRGVTVTARDPGILDVYGVGQVFHAKVERNGTVQLKAEVWLDLERVADVPELATIVDRLKAGQLIELSTGFETAAEEAPGTFEGEKYELVLHPLGADHLAIFAEKVGACSVQDGCGLGANEEVTDVNLSADDRGVAVRLLDRLVGLGKGGSSDADTTATRTASAFRILLLRLKSLALTPTELTNAIIGKELGLTAEQVARFERGQNQPKEEMLTKLQALVKLKMSGAGNKEHDLSDQERRAKLGDALENKFGGKKDQFIFIDAVFSEQLRLVFGLVTDNAVVGGGEQLFETEFQFATDGEITFTDPVEVERRVVYDKVSNTTEGGKMEKKDEQEKKPAENADAGASGKADGKSAGAGGGDADAAKGQVTNTQDGADKGDKGKGGEVTPIKPDAAADAGGGTEAKAASGPSAEDVTQLRNELKEARSAITSLQATVAPAVAERERERQTLVESLGANEAVPFDKAELETKPLDELRKLHVMSRGTSYAGQGGPVGNVTKPGSEQQYAEPVPYWEQDSKADKKGDE